MAKSKTAAAFTQTPSFTSLKDSAFQQAGAAQTLESVARYAIEKIEGFPKEVPSEAKDELYEGYRMKFDALNPKRTYAVINDHYVLATQEHMDAKNVEKIEIGVAYAFSYSSQEFGKLKSTNPALHGIVAQVRSRFSDYASNKLGDLKRAAKKLLDEQSGKTAQRQTLDFVESMTKIFSAQEKSVKVKQDRGDTTANALKFKQAVNAFWTTYK